MFEHVRAARERDVARAQDEAAAAEQRIGFAVDEERRWKQRFDDAEQERANAENTVATAQQQVTDAEGVVAQRTTEQGQAATALQDARTTLDRHLDAEPPDSGTGRPSPAWGRWNARRRALQQAVEAAEATMTAAGQAVAVAEADRVFKAGILELTRGALDGATARRDEVGTAWSAARGDVTAATTAFATAGLAVTAAQDRVGALPAREARLRAEPVDRADLEQAADAELADQHAALAARYAALTRRVAARAERAAELAALDATMDRLAVLHARIGSAALDPPWTSVAALDSVLVEVIAAHAVQRALPVTERTDDPESVRAALAPRLQPVRDDTNSADAGLSSAFAQVESAVAALVEHQKQSP